MPTCPVALFMLDPSPQLFLSSRALPEAGPKKRHMPALLLVGAIALFFLVFAARMTHDWAENHLLPDILVRSDWLITIVQAERLIMALAGLCYCCSSSRARDAARPNAAKRLCMPSS
jgi:hypothetical protein